MKKILFFMLIILSFAGSAFAVAVALPTHTPSTSPGVTIRGGSTAALAIAAPTPLIKCSTGVHAKVNFIEAAGSPGTSTGYTIATRHLTGSKYFATTNGKTNIYWKQAPKITATVTLPVSFLADVPGEIDELFSFGGTGGWTSY